MPHVLLDDTRPRRVIPLTPEGSQLAGWTMLAAVSVGYARIGARPRVHGVVAAERDGFVLLHLLAAGIVAALMVGLWRRLGPRGRLAAYGAIAAATFAIAGPFLYEDLAVVAGKIPIPYTLAHAVLIGAMAATVPVAALLGRLSARGRWWWLLGVVASIGVAVADELVEPNDYPGVHLVAGLAAASLFGAACARDQAALVRSRVRAAVLALVAGAAAFVAPRGRVALAVYGVPGDVVAPVLGVVRAKLAARAAQGDGDGAARGEWFASRLGRPPIPASSPRVVPANAIVVLILVDCMRADVLANPATAAGLPAMSALAHGGVSFATARATAPATAQSVSSIFSGRYYSQLYWKPRPHESVESVYAYADESPRFAEILARAGVDTVSFTGMPGLMNEYGTVKGISEEHYVRAPHWATAHEIMEPAMMRLRSQGGRPMFLYLHFTDAHAPYQHAGPEGTAHERYLRGIELVDTELDALAKEIESDEALAKRTTIVLSADHGEAFGEHGVSYHATTLYEELLRVPLVVRAPGVAARTIASPVSLIDLAPTILDLFGVPTPGEYMGQSLVPYLRGESPVLTRPIVADSSRLMRALVFPDGFKVIQDRRKDTIELYDLRTDPGETRELFAESGPEGVERLRTLEAFFHAHTLVRPGYTVPYGR